MSTLFAFLHHVCAFTLVAALAIEFALIKQELTLSSARRLQVTDLVLGIAAGLLLVIGLLRVFFFEKGVAYYWHSHAFLMKFSLFVIVGLLSIIPTREFLSWGGAIRAGQVPVWEASRSKRVAMVIYAELPRLSSFCCVPRSWRVADGFNPFGFFSGFHRADHQKRTLMFFSARRFEPDFVTGRRNR